MFKETSGKESEFIKILTPGKHYCKIVFETLIFGGFPLPSFKEAL